MSFFTRRRSSDHGTQGKSPDSAISISLPPKDPNAYHDIDGLSEQNCEYLLDDVEANMRHVNEMWTQTQSEFKDLQTESSTTIAGISDIVQKIDNQALEQQEVSVVNYFIGPYSIAPNVALFFGLR